MGRDVGEGDAEQAHALAEVGDDVAEKLGAACLKDKSRGVGRHVVAQPAFGVDYALRL